MFKKTVFLMIAALLTAGCAAGGAERVSRKATDKRAGEKRMRFFADNDTDQFRSARAAMVDGQIVARKISDKRVLDAMLRVPRHLFIPEQLRRHAYSDYPVPIGDGQTISQPYIVAFMTEALGIKKTDRVLEIGAGSGYQAAILAELAAEVYTIEIIESLGNRAKRDLADMGYDNVKVLVGDGYKGRPEHAPFDAIMVTAAPPYVPQPLIDQLKVGGKMILPVGDLWQELILITKTSEGVEKRSMIPVRFVPMTGEAQKKKK